MQLFFELLGEAVGARDIKMCRVGEVSFGVGCPIVITFAEGNEFTAATSCDSTTISAKF